MKFPFKKGREIVCKDLNSLQLIVYVDDMDDLGPVDFGSEYLLFIFQDSREDELFFLRYELDRHRYLEDALFLDENLPILSSLLGSEITVRRSVNTRYYDEIIYPPQYRGQPFYLEKEVPLWEIPSHRFFQTPIMHVLFEKLSSCFFLKKRTRSINPRLRFGRQKECVSPLVGEK